MSEQREFLAQWSVSQGNLRRFLEDLALRPLDDDAQRTAGRAAAAAARIVAECNAAGVANALLLRQSEWASLEPAQVEDTAKAPVIVQVQQVRGLTKQLDQAGLPAKLPRTLNRAAEAVLGEVREWQHRALDRMYPIVIFDALRVKIRDADSRMVKNKAVYIALGVTREGEREVLGLWIADNEGAKFWLSVMNELRNRGVQDILIAVVDGLKGFPEAITTAFPETMVQTCIVHLIRHSMNFCSWKDRKAVAADLRPIYEAPTAEEAARQLEVFEEKWAGKYPSIAPAWRRAWAEVTPFYAFSAAIRKIIYTTNAVESLNRVLRKTLKTKGSFPTEEAATKLIFLAIRNFEKGGRAVREWVAARNQLAIMFAGRFDA